MIKRICVPQNTLSSEAQLRHHIYNDINLSSNVLRISSRFPQPSRIGMADIFSGRAPELSTNREELISRAHGNCDEQNKVLEPSIMITALLLLLLLLSLIYITIA